MAKTYLAKATVELTSPTTGSKMKYTVDGTTPSNDSAVYSAPFDVYKNTKIKAVAQGDGLLDSEIASEDINIKLPLSNNDITAKPTEQSDFAKFHLREGFYDDNQAYYPTAKLMKTTDGTEPSAENGEVVPLSGMFEGSLAGKNGVYKFKYISLDHVSSDTVTINIDYLKCRTPIITVTGTEV